MGRLTRTRAIRCFGLVLAGSALVCGLTISTSVARGREVPSRSTAPESIEATADWDVPESSPSPSPSPGATPAPTLALERPTVEPRSIVARGAAGPLPTRTSVPRGFRLADEPESTETWSFDIYDARAPRWQEPDRTACTAASTVGMLNTIAYNGWDTAMVWQPNTAFWKQEEILRFERSHMTMRSSSAGSDPHGWRNALNYFGWGSLTAGVYRDATYTSMEAAEKAVVLALVRYRKPVGVLSQQGAHADFVTGYRVLGHDPMSGSTDFVVIGVYLSDPWRSAHYRDTYISHTGWRWGWTWLRFDRYRQVDSPYRDGIDGRVGRDEWYGKWVLVEPTR